MNDNQIIMHPLFLPKVVSKLLEQYADPQDLASFRLVSTDWYDVSLARFRSISKLIFHYEDGSIFLRHHRETNGLEDDRTSLQEFLQFVANPQNKCDTKPYRRIELRKWTVNPENNPFLLHDNLNGGFWRVIGPHVTSLTLNQCKFSLTPDIVEFRTLVYESCPNLKELILTENLFKKSQPKECDDDDDDNKVYVKPVYGPNRNLTSVTIIEPQSPELEFEMKYEEAIPVTWFEFFSHFPCLTYFKLKTHPRVDQISKELNALKAIAVIRRRDQNLLPFKKIELSDVFRITGFNLSSRKKLDLLRELNIPSEFKKLIIDKWRNNFPGFDNLLKDFFTYSCDSLRTVTCHSYVGEHSQFPFGLTMTNLKELHIRNNFCSTMEFLQWTPNLEEICFSGYLRRTQAPLQESNIIRRTPRNDLMNGLRLSSLRKFTCATNNMIDGNSDILRLTRWFPNLEELKMSLTNEQFGIVCQGWRKLKELTVLGDDLTDDGIIGRRAAAGEGHERGPNITWLTALESFDCPSRNLTEASVHQGILQLPSLKKLIIFRGIRIGEETEKMLFVRFGQYKASKLHGCILYR